MTTDELTVLAAKYRDEWAEELRFRLVEAVFNDAHDYLGWKDMPEDISTEDFLRVAELMAMSVGLEFWPVVS